MAGIENKKFQILDVSGNNYLSWCLDVKLHLQGMGLATALESVELANADIKNEANAMIFMRHHLSEDLKNEYIQIERPPELWKKLKDRFDHTRTVILPHAQYEWQLLRLQDFKSVADYNSALFKIESRLAFCGIQLSETDKLKKTFTTMHSSNMVLQQQYRQRQFQAYSELISVLLTAEKTNELLLRNHELRPSGSRAEPEAHTNFGRAAGRFKSRENRPGHRTWKSGGRDGYRQNNYRNDRGGRNYNNRDKYHYSHQNNYSAKPRQSIHGHRDKEKMPTNNSGDDPCRRCSITGHWAKYYRTAQHRVDSYQASIKNKGKDVQAHTTEIVEPSKVIEANTPRNIFDKNPDQDWKSLELADFLEDPVSVGHDSEWLK